MKIDFYLRFHTQFGQALSIVGNLPALGNNELDKALPLSFLNDEYWHTSIEIDPADVEELQYRYVFTEADEIKKEAEKQRTVELKKLQHHLVLIDTWNDESYSENAFYTTPFTEVFFRDNKKSKTKKPSQFTHQFKVKAPLLEPNETICIVGNSEILGSWKIDKPVLLHKKGNWWTIYLEIPPSDFAVSYKYGIYNTKKESFVQFESGDNRVLHNDGAIEKTTIVHDGFVRITNKTWKGAGLAIPVFSLRSNNSFGIGEFTDIKLLVDWSVEVGLKLIQLLPVNDTSATHTCKYQLGYPL